MATAKRCSACQKRSGPMYCTGCDEYFCSKDMRIHREGMVTELEKIIEERNHLQDEINNGVQLNGQQSPVLEQIDRWQKSTIEKVKRVAAQVRQQAVELLSEKQMKIHIEFKSFSRELIDLKESEDYVEHDLERLNQKINQFKKDVKNSAQPAGIVLHTEQSDEIHWESLIYLEEQRTTTIRDSNGRTRRTENVDPSEHEQSEIYQEEIIQQGTMIAASNFDANRDADALRKAMKGLGTDEQALIGILGNRNTSQRLAIKSAFTNRHNRDLTRELKSETSGNFAELLERMMMSAVELDCFELKQAVKGLGMDEEALIEILASHSNERIRSIKETYRKMYSKPLEEDVTIDTRGIMRDLLLSLIRGKRPQTTEINVRVAREDAQSFVDAGSAKFNNLNTLFCERSYPHLRAVFDNYVSLTGKSIEETVEQETSGGLNRVLSAFIRCTRSCPHYFAQRLRKACEGLGTSVISRIIITRSEIDLVQIKVAYQELFKQELERDIRADTSGDYRKLLLEILKDPSQRH